MKKGLFFLAILPLLHSPAQAAFIDDGWGARPVGLGGAFTAIADDSNAPLYNPAGIVQVQWNEMSAMYARLFSGLTLYAGQDTVHLDESYLSFVSKPSSFGSFGISWANFNTTHLYREDTVTFSYARYAGDFIPALDNKLSLGVNLKYLHRGISLDAQSAGDPVFSGGTSASAYTVDAGLLWKPEEGEWEGWRVGLSALNLTQPNVGFQVVDKVPMEVRLGVAHQSKQMPWLVPTFDLTRRNGITGYQGGVESWLFHDTVGLRAGANQDSASAGISYYQPINKKVGFRIDYSFTVPYYVEETGGSQRMALTVYF